MRLRSRRNHKTMKRRKNRGKSLKRKYKGGFSEISYFLDKTMAMFQMAPTVPYGNTAVVAPFPYFQSK